MNNSVPDATQFSAFSECMAKGVLILPEEGDDAVFCTDGGTREPKFIHS